MNHRARRQRRAAALLIVLFLMAITAPILCMMLDTQTTHIRCIHNDIEMKTALYIAQAGVHDAMAQLLADSAWRAGFTNKAFPIGLGHTYTVTLANAANNQIIITSTARTAQGHTKTVVATVTGF